jgi:hypothetical protein
MEGRTKLIVAVVSVVAIVAAIIIIATRKSDTSLPPGSAAEKKNIIDTKTNEVIPSTRGYVVDNKNAEGYIKNPNTGEYNCTEMIYCSNCKKPVSVLATVCPFCNADPRVSSMTKAIDAMKKAGKESSSAADKSGKGGDRATSRQPPPTTKK